MPWLTRQSPLPQPSCPTTALAGRSWADAMCAQPRGTLFFHNTLPRDSIQTDSRRMLLPCLIDLKLCYIEHHPIVMTLQSLLLLASILGWGDPNRDVHIELGIHIVDLTQTQLQNCFPCLWTREEKQRCKTELILLKLFIETRASVKARPYMCIAVVLPPELNGLTHARAYTELVTTLQHLALDLWHLHSLFWTFGQFYCGFYTILCWTMGV